MDSDISNGRIVHHIEDNLKIIIQREKDFIFGQTNVHLMDNGKITKCMDMVLLNGLIKDNILETILKIKNKDTENSFGLIIEHTKDTGIMENNMEKEYISTKNRNKQKENGLMV